MACVGHMTSILIRVHPSKTSSAEVQRIHLKLRLDQANSLFPKESHCVKDSDCYGEYKCHGGTCGDGSTNPVGASTSDPDVTTTRYGGPDETTVKFVCQDDFDCAENYACSYGTCLPLAELLYLQRNLLCCAEDKHCPSGKCVNSRCALSSEKKPFEPFPCHELSPTSRFIFTLMSLANPSSPTCLDDAKCPNDAKCIENKCTKGKNQIILSLILNVFHYF